MSAQLFSIVSEFETDEQAASYDRWFRAKVLEAMKTAPSHDWPTMRPCRRSRPP